MTTTDLSAATADVTIGALPAVSSKPPVHVSGWQSLGHAFGSPACSPASHTPLPGTAIGSARYTVMTSLNVRPSFDLQLPSPSFPDAAVKHAPVTPPPVSHVPVFSNPSGPAAP